MEEVGIFFLFIILVFPCLTWAEPSLIHWVACVVKCELTVVHPCVLRSALCDGAKQV